MTLNEAYSIVNAYGDLPEGTTPSMIDGPAYTPATWRSIGDEAQLRIATKWSSSMECADAALETALDGNLGRIAAAWVKFRDFAVERLND